MLFKEAMHNSLKYANARHAILHFSLEGAQANICFSDDGIGYDATTISKGYGLNNMVKRAAAIGGELTLESVPGKGTLVDLKFEL